MEQSFYPYLAALAWIGGLLLLGTLIRAKVSFFQKILFPASLIGGLISPALSIPGSKRPPRWSWD